MLPVILEVFAFPQSSSPFVWGEGNRVSNAGQYSLRRLSDGDLNFTSIQIARRLSGRLWRGDIVSIVESDRYAEGFRGSGFGSDAHNSLF
jgi:hypothetical protein